MRIQIRHSSSSAHLLGSERFGHRADARHGCFIGAVGILGVYVGMVNVPANTSSFPNQDHYRLGHVLAANGKALKRCSWADGLRQLTSVTCPRNLIQK